MIRRLATAAVAVALLAVPLAVPAGADVYQPDPSAAVSLRPTLAGPLQVFYRRYDGSVALLTKGSNWNGGVEGGRTLGGSVSTAPAGLVTDTGDATRFWVFAAGTNGAVYWRKATDKSNSDWTDWASLGGYTTSAPTAVCTEQGQPPWVFVRGVDGALWERTSAVAWHRIGGSILSGPSARPSNSGVCTGQVKDVVAIGADSAVWRWRTGTWSRVGGASSLTPSIVRYGTREWVFVVGTNGALYVASRSDGFRWSTFSKIGGTFTTAPSAAVWAEYPYTEPALTVAAFGTNGKLYRATRSLVVAEPWTIESD